MASKKLIKRKQSPMRKKSKRSKLQLWKQIAGVESKGPELKCVDVNSSGASPNITLLSTTASIQALNLITVGSSYFQRVGRSIHLKSVLLRGSLFPSGLSGNTGGEMVRVAIVYDRQPNGAYPTYSSIFQTVDVSGNGSSTAFDMPNLNNSERFLILSDTHIQLANTGLNAAVTAPLNGIQDQVQETNFEKYINIDDLPTNYRLDTGVIDAIASGALYLVTIGTTAAASAASTFNWVSRVRYTDA